MLEVGISVWVFGVILDVCGCAIFLVVNGEDVEASIFNTCD